MKNNSKRLLLTALAFILAAITSTSSALPAQQGAGLTAMPQRDGTTLNVKITGDEYFHYYQSEDDILLIEKDGIMYYAMSDADGKVIASAHKATKPGKRGVEADANNYSSIPVTDGSKVVIKSDTETVIKSVFGENGEATIYNINGVVVKDVRSLPAGLYIINGHKVVIK